MRRLGRAMWTVLGLCGLSVAGATTWVGADASTAGYGVRAGSSLLAVPRIGALGVEGSAEKGWQGQNRYAAALTLRDLNLPLTKVDAFASAGAEYRSGLNLAGLNLYGEAGLRGPVLGPVGWRAYARSTLTRQFGAGVGLEVRF
ncbi:hypothetical protein ACINK0_14160 [Deinococcus sp. VB343]|uniref:Uncharacterized protein n=1 Tax=Deinococcus sp. VB142 TaxID=3112952 RepID=A0AAU6Q2J2_9DEIO